MKPSILLIDGVIVDIVDDAELRKLFDHLTYYDMRKDLHDGCGFMTIVVMPYEQDMMLQRYSTFIERYPEYVILVHVDYAEDLTPREFAACIYHEIGHIVNGDLHTERSTTEQEYAADDYAIENSTSPKDIISAMKKLLYKSVKYDQQTAASDSYHLLINVVHKERIERLEALVTE